MSREDSEKLHKIAVTSCSDNPAAQMYERFGRTYWLLVYDPEKNSWQAIDNRLNRNGSQGVGVATAKELIRAGAGVVLTGETGPKSYRTLTAAGIRVVQNVSGTPFEAVQSWLEGTLEPATGANDAGSPDCLLQSALLNRNARNKEYSPGAGRTEVDGG